MERTALKLSPRELVGKKVKSLRKAGITPVHLYGAGTEPRLLQGQTLELIKAMAKVGSHAPLFINIDGVGAEHVAFVREIQWNPVTDQLVHVDLLKVDLTKRVTAEVPLVLVGESPAAKELGGTVMQFLRTVEVEALPLEVPDRLEADVAALLDLSSILRAKDIRLPPGVTLVTDPEQPVARVQVVKEVVAEVAAPAAEAAEAPAEEVPAVEGEEKEAAAQPEAKKEQPATAEKKPEAKEERGRGKK